MGDSTRHKALKAGSKRLDEHLDIVTMVRNNTALATLLRLMFSREERMMLRQQRRQKVLLINKKKTTVLSNSSDSDIVYQRLNARP